MNQIKYIVLMILYLITLLSLTVYSYSQIDLNLTLSANVFYQSFQKELIHLGYFNRPVSTLIYTVLIMLLFIFYFYILYLIKKKKLSPKQLIWLIFPTLFLFLSYPAFSHDIFNYIFDARIVTKYFANPYFAKALDFPSDPWIRFMHWTHRTYPYGPVWLIITLPFSYLAFGKFVVTLLNFKLMFVLFHLGNILLISKILEKLSPKNRLFGVMFYAANPLILIESLISPHNEVMMLFFLLLALYEGVVKNNFVKEILSLLLSGGIKFITIILLPLLFYFRQRFNHKNPALIFKLCFILVLPFITIQIYQRNSYPWYFVTLLGIGAIITDTRIIAPLLGAISIGGALYYIPYLYIGYYAPGVTTTQFVYFLTPIAIVGTWQLFLLVKNKIS